MDIGACYIKKRKRGCFFFMVLESVLLVVSRVQDKDLSFVFLQHVCILLIFPWINLTQIVPKSPHDADNTWRGERGEHWRLQMVPTQ